MGRRDGERAAQQPGVGPAEAAPPLTRHDRRGARRYGFSSGALVGLALLATQALPALPGLTQGTPGWRLAMGSGGAALLVLAALAWLAARAAPAALPAALAHAAHVHGARIAATLALLHSAAALALEPALLADLRPTGPLATLAGLGALALLAWLASIPWRDCRPIHAHPAAATRHVLLAWAAAVLALIHLLAQDHGGIGARRGAWALLLAAALAAVCWRRLQQRQHRRAVPVVASAGPALRVLARDWALAALLPIAASVLACAVLG